MADNKTRVTVNILGQEYVVRGTETAEYIKDLAAKVDRKMRQLSEDSALTTTQVAVLTALNFADECEKIKKEHQELLKMLEEEWN
ncbi:MAG: cell division protein ZapA [Thermoanaerobacteraceae bacterium]|nr:cell division protein ZapA [Thermoanaerobacteraceae bacterium]